MTHPNLFDSEKNPAFSESQRAFHGKLNPKIRIELLDELENIKSMLVSGRDKEEIISVIESLIADEKTKRKNKK